MRFATTRWNLVAAAGRSGTASSQQALDDLCRIYWPPLYEFVRHRGYSHEQAEDLTQAFFAQLLANHSLDAVDRSKGRFRSFLLASIRHSLANDWDKTRTLKRGGGVAPIPLDGEAEGASPDAPVDTETPESLFDRAWALALLGNVLKGLGADYVARGHGALFDELKGALCSELPEPAYAEIGARLHMSTGAVRIAAFRLRERYRQRLRAHVARTVSDPAEIDDELRFLLSALCK